MRHLAIVALAGPVLLAACAPGSPGAIALDSPAALQQERTSDLCWAFATAYQPTVRDELLRRGALTQADLNDAARDVVHIGMSKCAALAAWGAPAAVNKTVTAGGEMAQFVYGGGQYLYLEGDRVTAIQQ